MPEIPTPRKVADDLRGTCKSLSEVLEWHGAAHLEDDMEFCVAIDDMVACCSVCDWWHELSEMADHDDWRCAECDAT